ATRGQPFRAARGHGGHARGLDRIPGEARAQVPGKMSKRCHDKNFCVCLAAYLGLSRNGRAAPREAPWRGFVGGVLMAERRRGRPTAVGEALHSYLAKSGLVRRVAQAQVIPDWPRLVGAQIAAVTTPESVTPD